MLNYNIRNEIVNKIYKLNYQDCIEELKEIEHTFGDRENDYWDDGAFYQEHTIKIIRNIMVNKHSRGKEIYETKKFIIKYKYKFVEENMNDENIPYIYQNDDKIYRFKLDTCVYVEKNEKTLVFNNFNEIEPSMGDCDFLVFQYDDNDFDEEINDADYVFPIEYHRLEKGLCHYLREHSSYLRTFR